MIAGATTNSPSEPKMRAPHDCDLFDAEVIKQAARDGGYFTTFFMSDGLRQRSEHVNYWSARAFRKSLRDEDRGRTLIYAVNAAGRQALCTGVTLQLAGLISCFCHRCGVDDHESKGVRSGLEYQCQRCGNKWSVDK